MEFRTRARGRAGCRKRANKSQQRAVIKMADLLERASFQALGRLSTIGQQPSLDVSIVAETLLDIPRPPRCIAAHGLAKAGDRLIFGQQSITKPQGGGRRAEPTITPQPCCHDGSAVGDHTPANKQCIAEIVQVSRAVQVPGSSGLPRAADDRSLPSAGRHCNAPFPALSISARARNDSSAA